MLISCGKEQANNIVLPSNEATEAENQILSGVLDKLQADFDAIGVDVDLRSIPYHVATMDNSLGGYCVYKADGTPTGIAINHAIFNYWPTETETQYGPIYRILLHEIGHCFFGRDHDDGMLTLPDNSTLELSVMKDYGTPYVLKALWPYYVKEIAGQDRLTSPEDLNRYL